MRRLSEAVRRVRYASRVALTAANRTTLLNAWRSLRIRRDGPAARRLLTEDTFLQLARREAWALSQESPPRLDVTVVCVTERPHCLDRAIANYERQLHEYKHLFLVTNSAAFDSSAVQHRLEGVKNAVMIATSETASLGACLNLALERCESRYLAKFDDDDRYGQSYLRDMLLALQYSNAAIAGKNSYFAYIQDMGRYVLRFPGREYRYTSHVSGATLLIDLSRMRGAQFPDRSVGEDSAYLRECQRRGELIFSADRFNYVQYRGDHNNWVPPMSSYVGGSLPIDPDTPEGAIEI